MRGAQRSIANIWAVASRIKGYYGKRDLQTGGREASWTRRGGSRWGRESTEDGAGQVEDQVFRGARTWGSEAQEDGNPLPCQRLRAGRVLRRRSPQRLGKGRGSLAMGGHIVDGDFTGLLILTE